MRKLSVLPVLVCLTLLIGCGSVVSSTSVSNVSEAVTSADEQGSVEQEDSEPVESEADGKEDAGEANATEEYVNPTLREVVNEDEANVGDIISYFGDGNYAIMKGRTCNIPIVTQFNLVGLDESFDKEDYLIGITKEYMNILKENQPFSERPQWGINTYQVTTGVWRYLGFSPSPMSSGEYIEDALVSAVQEFYDMNILEMKEGQIEALEKKPGYYLVVARDWWKNPKAGVQDLPYDEEHPTCGIYYDEFIDILNSVLGMITPDAYEVTELIVADAESEEKDGILGSYHHEPNQEDDGELDHGVVVGNTKVIFIGYSPYHTYYRIQNYQ